MRYQKPPKPMDEREKLRKFRELDDAFAEALQDLDKTGTSSPDAAHGDGVSVEERQREQESERQRAFERRLEALMQEYRLPAESVSTLMHTLIKLGKIA